MLFITSFLFPLRCSKEVWSRRSRRTSLLPRNAMDRDLPQQVSSSIHSIPYYPLLIPLLSLFALCRPEIKQELGVAPERNFESCNMKINQAFQFNGDVSHNTAALLPPLLEAGIRVLMWVFGDWGREIEWMLIFLWYGLSLVMLEKQISCALTLGISLGLVRSFQLSAFVSLNY